ncbi:MAG: carboxypeptidase regulatory-like domain-containing protein [Planctomycetes bacterium]|nr:carboxypeptidase regulatory-like domain-containing protein [Planctomycetota bacterium]
MRPIQLVLGTLLLFAIAMLGVLLFSAGDESTPRVDDRPAAAAPARSEPSADAADGFVADTTARAEAVAESNAPATGPVAAPARLPKAEQLTAKVAGRVRDEAGNPIAGAVLELEPGMRNDRLSMPFSEFEAKGESGADGAFTFAVPEIGVFRLAVTKAGFAVREVTPLVPNDEVDVVLKRGMKLGGLLREESTGLPVAGARVRIQQGFADQEATSDARGAFEFTDLDGATARLEVYARGFDVLELDGVLPGAEGADHLDLALVPGVPLVVAVLDGFSGQPIPGAALELAASRLGRDDEDALLREQATTDATGTYRFEAVSRRELALLVRADGFAAEQRDLEEDSGADEWRVEVTLVKSCTLGGVVLDASGNPREGAQVSVRGGGRFDADRRNVETDAAGRFTFSDVRPGADLEVVAFAPDSEFGPCRVQGVVAAEGETIDDLELMLEPAAAVTVTVLDSLGQPAPFARVLVDEVPNVVWRALDRGPMQFTNEEGKLGLEQMPSGNIKLSARVNQFYSEPLELTLVSGQRAEATLQLIEGLVITGRVTDPSGQGVDDAVVTAFAMDPNWTPPQNLGNARGRNNDRGDGANRGGGGGGGRGGRGGPLGPGGGDGGFTRRVFGAATGGGDRGMASFRALVRSDANGSFVVKGLRADEKLAIAVRHENYAPRFVMSVDPQSPPTIILQPNLTLVGQVVDASTRRPLIDFSVSADPIRDESIASDPGMVMSAPTPRSQSFHAANGAFALADLQPGPYNLRVRASGYKESAPIVVQVVQGLPPLVLEAARAAEVSGRLTARNGASVSRLNVFLAPIEEPKPGAELKLKRGRPQSQRTNKDGGFRFRDVKEGWYGLGAGSARAPVVKPVAIFVGNGELIERSLQVDGVGQVVVKVDGKGGLSLAGATLQLESNALGYRDRLRTDSLGRVTFANLVPGTYTLSATHPSYNGATKQMQVQDGETRTENVSLGSK